MIHLRQVLQLAPPPSGRPRRWISIAVSGTCSHLGQLAYKFGTKRRPRRTPVQSKTVSAICLKNKFRISQFRCHWHSRDTKRLMCCLLLASIIDRATLHFPFQPTKSVFSRSSNSRTILLMVSSSLEAHRRGASLQFCFDFIFITNRKAFMVKFVIIFVKKNEFEHLAMCEVAQCLIQIRKPYQHSATKLDTV